MFCKCCCKPVLTDDFNRADNTDLGSSWVEISSGAEIKSNTLQIASPGLIRTEGITYPSVTVDSVNYSGSSKVSVKWTPLDTSNPVVSHVIFGQRDILGGTAISRYIGLELTCDSSGIAPTISARLYTAGPTYITDPLPIGWDDGPFYTSGASYDASDKYFDITLCWEPMRYYSLYSRTGMAVKATIGSYTGAFYTLEGVVSGAPTIQDVFLECSSGTARWDDFSWRRTKPDFVNCPYCGQCLFAADMTTAGDQGTAAYSSSGGTFARNVTTGALELTSTTATWLVDLPARNSLSLNYSADWAGSSPTFDVEIGAIRLQISKTLTPEQVIAVTVNGSGATSIYTSLTNSTLNICFNAEKIVVDTATTHNEYTSTDNTGYVNLKMTAGSSKVSVTEIRSLRTDNAGVTNLNCSPCNVSITVDCEVCPSQAYDCAIVYGVDISTNYPLIAPTPSGFFGPKTQWVPSENAFVCDRTGYYVGIGSCMASYDELTFSVTSPSSQFMRFIVEAGYERESGLPTARWRIRADIYFARAALHASPTIGGATYYSDWYEHTTCPNGDYIATTSGAWVGGYSGLNSAASNVLTVVEPETYEDETFTGTPDRVELTFPSQVTVSIVVI